jgi:ankyrin repeat protein
MHPKFLQAWPPFETHFVIFPIKQAVYRCAFHLLSGLNGFSQLHIAMRRGDVVALQMLLAGGADVNATDSWGNTPLLYWPVAPSEPVELVEELLIKLLSHVSAHDMSCWCCEACSVGRASGLPQGAGRTGRSQATCHGSYPFSLLPFAVLSRAEVASADTTGADCLSPTSALGSLVVVLRHRITGL